MKSKRRPEKHGQVLIKYYGETRFGYWSPDHKEFSGANAEIYKDASHWAEVPK